MQYQEITFKDPGQLFVFDPPDGRAGLTPAPSVCVYDGKQTVAATAGACTVDPVETRLHGDALAGARAIRVTSTDGLVRGGRYLMTKPEGDREWLDVVAIDDGKLVLKHPLIHRYAGNATIVGCRLSIGVDPAWAATAANLSEVAGRGRGLAGYLLRWTYTVGGFEITGISFADLVSCRSEQLVTPLDVERRFPGWIAGLPPEHRENQGADFIAEAFRAVRIEAVGDAHAQRKIRDAHVLRELVNLRTHVSRIEHDVIHGERRSGELTLAEERYHACYTRLVDETAQPDGATPSPSLSLSLSLPAKPGRRRSLWRRIPKLTNQ